MAAKQQPGKVVEIPSPVKHHPVIPPINPEELVIPEDDPDKIPDEDPFETPAYESPAPAEGP